MRMETGEFWKMILGMHARERERERGREREREERRELAILRVLAEKRGGERGRGMKMEGGGGEEIGR